MNPLKSTLCFAVLIFCFVPLTALAGTQPEYTLGVRIKMLKAKAHQKSGEYGGYSRGCLLQGMRLIRASRRSWSLTSSNPIKRGTAQFHDWVGSENIKNKSRYSKEGNEAAYRQITKGNNALKLAAKAAITSPLAKMMPQWCQNLAMKVQVDLAPLKELPVVNALPDWTVPVALGGVACLAGIKAGAHYLHAGRLEMIDVAQKLSKSKRLAALLNDRIVAPDAATALLWVINKERQWVQRKISFPKLNLSKASRLREGGLFKIAKNPRKILRIHLSNGEASTWINELNILEAQVKEIISANQPASQ